MERIVCLLLILAFFALLAFAIHRRNPRRRLNNGRLQFWVKGVPMSQAILKPGQKVTATVDFTAQGKPGQPASPPTWSSDTPGAASVTPTADGMSADIEYVGPGASVITVKAEGDPTPGVNTITLQGTVTCTNPEIDAGEIVFGAPTP